MRKAVPLTREIEEAVNWHWDRRTSRRRINLDSPVGRLRNFYRKVMAYDSYMLWAHVARAAAECPPGARVLDAGSGESQYGYLFRHARLVACDFAEGDADWDYSGLDAICDLERLPFATGSFDVCVLTEVLEHLKRPDVVLGELSRVMRSGGSVYVTVPQSFGEHQIPHDYFRYTTFSLRFLADQAGFEPAEVVMRTGFPGFLSFYISLAIELYWEPRLRPSSKAKRLLLLPVAAVTRLAMSGLKLFLYAFDHDGLICVGYNCVFVKR